MIRWFADGLIRYLAEFRWGVLALLGCSVLLAWAVIGKAVGDDPSQAFDNRIEIWFLDDDPSLEAYREFQRVFGNGEAIVIALQSEGDSIFNDSLGHADDILVELGRLVWLRAIYGVDLSTYDYDPGYTVDLLAIADSIMDEHDPAYDAP